MFEVCYYGGGGTDKGVLRLFFRVDVFADFFPSLFYACFLSVTRTREIGSVSILFEYFSHMLISIFPHISTFLPHDNSGHYPILLKFQTSPRNRYRRFQINASPKPTPLPGQPTSHRTSSFSRIRKTSSRKQFPSSPSLSLFVEKRESRFRQRQTDLSN